MSLSTSVSTPTHASAASAGSHVIFALQQTRRYKVISVDNHHNSSPRALERVAKIARDDLPADASPQDKDSAEIDAHIAMTLMRVFAVLETVEGYDEKLEALRGRMHSAGFA